MDDDRVTLNAGGRIFETTALTLKTSGAGYFEALLGETGAKLPGRKRARVSADGDDAPGGHRELFIDRDPDRFADVLSFMRTSRLPAAAARPPAPATRGRGPAPLSRWTTSTGWTTR